MSNPLTASKSRALSQGEDLARASRLGRSKNHDVNLDLGAIRRVRNDPGSHFAWQATENARIGRNRESAADRLEMRSYHLRQETRPGSGPDRRRVTEFEARPFPTHDGLIEGYERLRYAVPSPPRPETGEAYMTEV